MVVYVYGADGQLGSALTGDVELTTWIDESDIVTTHWAPLNERGVATYRFEGLVHVDFVRLRSPSPSLALAFLEVHMDLEPGTRYEVGIGLAAPAVVHGRVQDERGQPLSGVPVDAYGADYDDHFHGAWSRGLFTTTTDAGGSFRLQRLPAGDWNVCVPSDEWVQLTPNLREEPEGRLRFQVEAGDVVDAGVFRITRAHRFDLTVVHGDGTPMVDASVLLTPQSLASPAIEFLDDDESWRDQWLRGALPNGERAIARGLRRSVWEYGALEAQTSDQGTASFLGAAGSWELEVAAALDCFPGGVTHRQRIELPRPALHLRLPGLVPSWEAEILDPEGAPATGLRVTLTRRLDDCQETDDRFTDSAGRVRFENLPDAGEFCLSAERHPGNQVLDVRLGRGAPRDFESFRMEEAFALDLRFVDRSGAPAPGLTCRLNGSITLANVGCTRTQRRIAHDGQVEVDLGSGGNLSVLALRAGPHEIEIARRSGPGRERLELGRYSFESHREGEEPETVALPLDPLPPSTESAATHHGLVLDALSGYPVHRALVWFESSEQRASASTDRDGEFSLSLLGRTGDIAVRASGYLPRSYLGQRFKGNDVRHTLHLDPRDAATEVEISDATGRPIDHLYVTLRDAQGEPILGHITGSRNSWRDTLFPDGGRFALEGLPSGPMSLGLSLFGLELEDIDLVVPPGPGPHRVILRLEESLEELRERVREQDDS